MASFGVLEEKAEKYFEREGWELKTDDMFRGVGFALLAVARAIEDIAIEMAKKNLLEEKKR